MERELRVKFELITRNEDDGSFRVLIVEGPWEGERSSGLERLAHRLADSATAILSGQLTALYPWMRTNKVTLQLDSYDTPRAEVDALVEHLREQIQSQLPSEFVGDLQVEHNWFDWQEEYDRRHPAKPKGFFAKLRGLFAGA